MALALGTLSAVATFVQLLTHSLRMLVIISCAIVAAGGGMTVVTVLWIKRARRRVTAPLAAIVAVCLASAIVGGIIVGIVGRALYPPTTSHTNGPPSVALSSGTPAVSPPASAPVSTASPDSVDSPTGSADDLCAAIKPVAGEPQRQQSCTPLSLKTGTSADLDLVGAAWGTAGAKRGPGEDIYANGSHNLEVKPGRLSLALVDKASYESCSSASDWNDEVLAPKVGTVVCVKTDHARLAVVVIRGVTQNAPVTFDMEVIVWK
jgi:hypothetical protein